MTNELSVTPTSNPARAGRGQLSLPKSRRLLKPAEFRQVYDQGFKVPCTCFVAFCWKAPLPAGDAPAGPKVGFTTPRALGKATVRNRMRRRLRETVRRNLGKLDARWSIVWNLRRASLAAPQVQLDSEVQRVFERCSG